MTNSFLFEEISKQVKSYVFAILFSTKKKNCSAMSREIRISKKQLYKVYEKPVDNAKQIEKLLIDKVKKHCDEKLPSVLIIDPTNIRKWFANDIENLAYDYDGIIQKSKKCLVPVIAAWTNSKITIPLTFSFWINKRLVKKYKNKLKIAEKFIFKIKKLIQFDYVALDGAFASQDMIAFLNKINIHFCMRIPRNRLIISKNGIQAQLQNHPALKLKGNQCYKKIRGIYKGHKCYFTAHKRYSKNRTSHQIVFIVSSLNLSAKKQAEAYGIRWNIEKMFRTMKQSLGFGDCQCLSAEKQTVLIFSVFLAYAKLEEEKIFKRNKSPEEILTRIRTQKNSKRCRIRPIKKKVLYVEA